MRTIRPILVGAIVEAEEVQVKRFAESYLPSGAIAVQLAIQVFDGNPGLITYRANTVLSPSPGR
jgi:hypothetical protein